MVPVPVGVPYRHQHAPRDRSRPVRQPYLLRRQIPAAPVTPTFRFAIEAPLDENGFLSLREMANVVRRKPWVQQSVVGVETPVEGRRARECEQAPGAAHKTQEEAGREQHRAPPGRTAGIGGDGRGLAHEKRQQRKDQEGHGP